MVLNAYVNASVGPVLDQRRFSHIYVPNFNIRLRFYVAHTTFAVFTLLFLMPGLTVKFNVSCLVVSS